MMFAALLGALDDYMGILRIGSKGGGLRMSYRMLLYILAGAVGRGGFISNLVSTASIFLFRGLFNWLVVYTIFIFTIVATAFSANETDGLDGFGGGIFLDHVQGLCCNRI